MDSPLVPFVSSSSFHSPLQMEPGEQRSFRMNVPKNNKSLKMILCLLIFIRIFYFMQDANYESTSEPASPIFTRAEKERHTTYGPDPFKKTATQPPAPLLHADDFFIVTATSGNHFLESIPMLRTLIKTHYTGQILVYLIKLPDNEEEDERKYQEFAEQIQKSPLKARIILYKVSGVEYLKTYCWKPSIIQHALTTIRQNQTTKVFMWSDASTRFQQNPWIFAQRIQRDNVDFAGRTSRLGMGENTHPLTYQFLNKSIEDYRKYYEISATQFLFRWMSALAQSVLPRWFDCAADLHCRQCMAPDLSSKTFRGRIQGPPSTTYVIPRQDQAVLGLLLYENYNISNSRIHQNIQVGNLSYMNVTTIRKTSKRIKQYSDLNRNQH